MKTSEGKVINERGIDWTALIIFLIPAILMGVGWYYVTSYRVEALENRTVIVEEKCDKIDVLVSEVGWIKDTMKQVYKLK